MAENQQNSQETDSHQEPLEEENNESNLDDASTQQSKSQTKSIEEQLKEAEEKYVYLYADFENFKKRVQKEKQDLRQFAIEGLALELLSVLDNFSLALKHADSVKGDSLVEGIRMVHKLFLDALERNGIQRIEAKGKPFDPNLHDAVEKAPSDQVEETIIDVQQEGYRIHGRLLRPAKVIVSAGKSKEKS